MRVFVAITAILLVFVVGGVVAYNSAYPTYSYRYRLTVAFELDGKVHAGSSVIEIRWIGHPNIPDAGSFSPQVRGQAAFVDLGSRGAVVAALGTGQTSQDVPDGSVSALWFAAQAFGNNSTNQELPDLQQLRGRRNLALDNMPRLIWFPNIADPKSAKRFFVKDIPTLFGPSARLAAAYVEITDAPIVIDIDKKFPWFDVLNRPLSQGVVRVEYGFGLRKTMFIGAAS